MPLELGILISDKKYARLVAGSLEHWRLLAIDHERRFHLRKLFISPGTIDPVTKRGQVAIATSLYWQEVKNKKMPRFFYNMIAHPYPHEAKLLRALNGNLDTILFNETNRWNRGLVFPALRSSDQVQELIPETWRCTANQLENLESGTYLLAHSKRNLRKGALLLVIDDGTLVYTNLLDGSTGHLQLADSYILLDKLPAGVYWLSKLAGLPLGPDGPAEWRVYLLRSSTGWKVVGALAKQDILRFGHALERCWTLDEGLTLTFGAQAKGIADRILAKATAIAEVFSLFIPGTANCTVDFWILPNGQLVLADMRGIMRTNWLRKINDIIAVKAILEHPVHFAREMHERGVEVLDVDFDRARPERKS